MGSHVRSQTGTFVYQNHYMLTKFVLTPKNHRQKLLKKLSICGSESRRMAFLSQDCFQLPNRNASKSLQQSPTKTTLRGTNISELGKRKIIDSKVFWEGICSFSGRVTGNHHSFQYHNVKNQRFVVPTILFQVRTVSFQGG